MENKVLKAISSVDNFISFSDLVPLEYGYENCTINNWKIKRGQKARYTIFFVKKGSGTFRVDGNTYEVREKEGFIVMPFEDYTYEPDKKNPWYYAHICFSGSLSYKFSYLPRKFNYDIALFDELIEICNYEKMTPFYLSGFLHKLCGVFSLGDSENPDLKTLHFNAAMLYINHHFSGDLTVDAVAKFMKLNKRYLSRIFKSVAGTTVRDVLIKKRLELAMGLLSKGESVTLVAEKAGYKDAPSFSKAFCKFYGFPPSKIKTKRLKPE